MDIRFIIVFEVILFYYVYFVNSWNKVNVLY
jgi:hypothetical protein